jgi:cardiolipin synthase A/B
MARRRRWPWIVASVIVTLGILLLIAQDQVTLRVSSPVTVDDPTFPDYVASLVGAPVTRGDTYIALQNGDEIFASMLDAIRRARRRISFESFVYSDGEMARAFTQALTDAAHRGVRVRIVLDSFGALDLPRERTEPLRSAGVGLVWFNPLRSWTLEQANYRTHRKILVVDGTVAFTGGVGVADHWRGKARNEHEWRDTQFRITGPAVRAIEAAFYENWLESGGFATPALDPPSADSLGRARSIVVWSNPTAGVNNVKLLYLLSIAGARKSIDIESPYFVLDSSTRGALDAARSRGVRVRLVTDGDCTDTKTVKAASRDGYGSLLDAGYEISEYEPTMMHVKAMVVDGGWSVVGTANFDNRSFELNDELTVAVADPLLAQSLITAFERDRARSRRLNAHEWRNRSVFTRWYQHFWGLFDEVL